MATYIVTGGAGFIGSHIVDALIDRGDEVHVVDNFFTGKRERVHPNAILHEIDIRDFGKLVSLFRGARGIFHMAAQSRVPFAFRDPLLSHEINSAGTLNVLIAARDAGVKRVIYPGSYVAYGPPNFPPFREDMDVYPVTPYAIQKCLGEQYCQMISRFFSLETVVFRFVNVYGPRQSGASDGPSACVIGIFFEQRKRGEPITVVSDGTQRRDFVHVSDVVRANLYAMESKNVGKGEIINIGTGKNYSMIEVAETIGGPWKFVDARPGETPDILVDITKARELISFEPRVSFYEGVDQLKTYYGV